MLKGKSKAERLLQQVKTSNDYLKDSLADIVQFLSRHEPQVAALSTDGDMRAAGLSVQVERLRIQNGAIKPDKKATIRDASFVEVLPSAVLVKRSH